MRPAIDEYFLDMALLISSRSTCARRKVGAVLVDSNNWVLATGYNGVPSGFEHCTDAPCSGAQFSSGEGLEFCRAIHAEQNAILQGGMSGNLGRARTIYCTTAPCITCVKLLLNTSVNRMVAMERYMQPLAENMWTDAGRAWEILFFHNRKGV